MIDHDEESAEPVSPKPESSRPTGKTFECGICFDEFTKNAHLRPSSSRNILKPGSFLACNHGFCHECTTQYIVSKLSDNKLPTCPTCAREIHPAHIGQWMDRDIRTRFWSLKLGTSGDIMYCPNKKCSEAILVDEDDPFIPDPYDSDDDDYERGHPSYCPKCETAICFHCRTPWHHGFTCDEFQALPPDERSREDVETLRLARNQNWQRCPRCKAFVSKNDGCHHMTCRCGEVSAMAVSDVTKFLYGSDPLHSYRNSAIHVAKCGGALAPLNVAIVVKPKVLG